MDVHCLQNKGPGNGPDGKRMVKILIVGSGGHARVVADALLAAGDNPLGYLSRDAEPGATGPLGLPVLGSDAETSVPDHDGVVLAIGDNRTRKNVADGYRKRGGTFLSAIHPSAVIAADAVIEPGCMICAGVVVNSGSRIRAHTILNTGCTVDHDCDVGPFAHIAPGVNLAGDVTVGEGSFLGIGTCVVQGITIGEWATAGAGAAVIRDVEPKTTVVGVPARKI